METTSVTKRPNLLESLRKSIIFAYDNAAGSSNTSQKAAYAIPPEQIIKGCPDVVKRSSDGHQTVAWQPSNNRLTTYNIPMNSISNEIPTYVQGACNLTSIAITTYRQKSLRYQSALISKGTRRIDNATTSKFSRKRIGIWQFGINPVILLLNPLYEGMLAFAGRAIAKE